MFLSRCSSAASTDQSHILHQDTFCQNNLIYMLNVLKLTKCPTGILAFCPPICSSSILFNAQSHSSQMSFCFQAIALVLQFLRIKMNNGSVTFLRNPQQWKSSCWGEQRGRKTQSKGTARETVDRKKNMSKMVKQEFSALSTFLLYLVFKKKIKSLLQVISQNQISVSKQHLPSRSARRLK